MPTFSYKGYNFEVDHTPSEQEFSQMSAYVDTLPPKVEKPKESKGLLDQATLGLKSSFANVGNMIDLAGTTIAGSGAALFGDDKEAVRLADEMEARRTSRNQWANPENEALTGFGKVVGTVGTLPMQVATMGLSPAETTRTALQSGESNSAARKAGMVDALGNAVGVALPGFKQGTALVRGLTGAGANMAQEVVTKKSIQAMMDTEKGRQAFAPTIEDTLVSGVVGGGFGAALGRTPTKQTKRSANALTALDALAETKKAPTPEGVEAMDSLKQAFSGFDRDVRRQKMAERPTQGAEVLPVDAEGNVGQKDLGTQLAMEQQRQALQAKWDAEVAAMQAAEQYKPNDGLDGQRNLFDPEVEGRGISPYEAVPGNWMVDENGMPYKDDLSSDVLTMQEPLQRNLFGDELEPSFPRDPNRPLPLEGGDVPGVERFSDPVNFRNDPENQRPLTEAIDSMDPVARTAALEQTAMGREMPASPEMEVAKMEAEGAPAPMLGSKARRDAFIRSQAGQRGAIAPDVFLKDFPEFVKSKIKDATGALKVLYHGTSKDTPFKDVKAGSTGAWLTDDPAGASEYAKQNDSQKMEYVGGREGFRHVNTASRVMPVYANIERPYTLSETDLAGYRTASNYTKYQRELTAKAKAQGYDGIDWGGGIYTTFDAKQIKNALSPKFNGKKQSGGVLFDWKKKPEIDQLSKIAGLRENLKDFIPTEMTAESTLAAAKGMKDVDQNIAQKAVNMFTKGGLYQAIKTGNPLVKFAVDKVLNADRLGRADTRDYIHDSLAPAMRALSTKERTEIASVLNHADKVQVEVTPEFLKSQGFSDKQLAFAEAHKVTMDKAFESINAARAEAGLEPINRRTAYAAMNARGDFRKLVHTVDAEGNKTVVGFIGAKTRRGLASLEKKVKAMNPEYVVESKERYMGGAANERGGSAVAAVQQALEMLAEKNAGTKEFLDLLDNIKTDEAYSYMGAKAHTKQKKGVFGMEGRKPWETEEQNAKDFMDAQLQYAEAAIKWGHVSKAASEVKKILADDTVNMPNAKQWAEGYMQNALGMNPTKLGRSFERVLGTLGDVTGVGTTIPANAAMYSRKVVNTMLLGLNPAFLSTNIIQPMLSMPAMTTYLKGKGIDAMTTGYDSMAKAGFTLFKEKMGKLSPLEAEAQAYAHKNHVFGSDLVDTSNISRKNAEFYLDKTGNFLASNIESGTRKLMYYGFVHMLADNGLGKDFGLAQNLTDIAMNNYSPIERPQVFNAFGPIGDMAANLSSYKHNELSRLAMFAREIGNDKNAAPFLMQIATSAAAAGITGVLGFQEADWLYKQVTKAMGKPDSLSRVVIEFSEDMAKAVDSEKGKYVGSHGVFSLLGLDMAKRLGISDVVPDTLPELMFPGGSKLAEVAGAGLSAVKDPSEMNLKRLAREAAPGMMTGPMDREWFSKDTPEGELSYNRRTLEPQVIRNEADKMAKNIGFTGINESVQKQKLYDLQQQGIGYQELRQAVYKKMKDSMYSKGKIDPKMIENYLAYEGDLDTLNKSLETDMKNQTISAVTAAQIKALAAKTIPTQRQGQRVLKAFQ